MRAAAADPLEPLDNRHLLAVLDRLHGGPFAPRPAADHKNVEMLRIGHVRKVLLAPLVAENRGRRLKNCAKQYTVFGVVHGKPTLPGMRTRHAEPTASLRPALLCSESLNKNVRMKMTIELPDALIKQVKVRALRHGQKLKDAVADLLRQGLAVADDQTILACPRSRRTGKRACLWFSARGLRRPSRS